MNEPTLTVPMGQLVALQMQLLDAKQMLLNVLLALPTAYQSDLDFDSVTGAVQYALGDLEDSFQLAQTWYKPTTNK